MTTLYKYLGENGEPCNGGKGKWPLPTKNADGSWTPGEWLEVEGPLVACENGLHLLAAHDLLDWSGPDLWEVEAVGEMFRAGDKIVARCARLTRHFDTWDERTQRLLACDFAEHVLHIFEDRYPDDDRPRKAIETARRFANGQATREELAAARDARTAAWDAERKWQTKRLLAYLW